MIHMVGTSCVDINGTIFPAANIQIYDCYPNPHYNVVHKRFYGLFFEMMFENGFNAEIYQEDVAELNGEGESLCESPRHFIVEITHRDDGHQEVIHAYHCNDEDELAKTLNQEKLLSAIRDEFSLDDSFLSEKAC